MVRVGAVVEFAADVGLVDTLGIGVLDPQPPMTIPRPIKTACPQRDVRMPDSLLACPLSYRRSGARETSKKQRVVEITSIAFWTGYALELGLTAMCGDVRVIDSFSN